MAFSSENNVYSMFNSIARHYALEGYVLDLKMDFMMAEYHIRILQRNEYHVGEFKIPHYITGTEYTYNTIYNLIEKAIRDYDLYLKSDDYLIYKFTNGYKHDEDRLKKLIKTNPELLF